LIADTYYDDFLTSFYKSSPSVAELGYKEQHARLMARRFGCGDAYSVGLRNIGIEAETMVLNARPLQAAWAREQGFIPAGRTRKWDPDVFIAQVQALRPDVLYLQELSVAREEVIAAVKPFTRLIVGQIACSVPSNRNFAHHDIIVSSWKPIVHYFRDRGKRAEYLPLGFDARVVNDLHDVALRLEVTFVGGLGNVHAERIALLEYLAARSGIAIFGYGMESLPKHTPIRPRHHGPAWGLDAYRVLAASRITINSHGTIDVAGRADTSHANNLRLFEATGVGTMLLTDWKEDLSALFTVDRELVTYHSPAECLEQIRYFLQNDDARSTVAAAGQRRTLKEHTYDQRMQQLYDILAAHL